MLAYVHVSVCLSAWLLNLVGQRANHIPGALLTVTCARVWQLPSPASNKSTVEFVSGRAGEWPVQKT